MNYPESIDYLNTFGRFGVKPGLERIQALLERMGNPHGGLKVIHVAGTNGKGSVCSMIESILRKAGYRTGLYTSPHLVSFTERIKVNGQEIPKWRLAELVTRFKSLIEEFRSGNDPGLPTEFEIITALAFYYFAQMQVDLAVIEVGLGGRFDATNIVDPLISVITHISFDHTKILGNTLAAIAREKAGIIKPGRPVISSPQSMEALEVIERTCHERGSNLILVGRDFKFSVQPTTANEMVDGFLEGKVCDLSGRRQYQSIRVPFLGFHQVENCATAVAAIEALEQQGIKIGDDAIREGLASARWPGRLEIVSRNPYFILDGAHNLDGINRLCETLDEATDSKDFTGKVRVVIGISRDKPGKKLVGRLSQSVDYAICTMARTSRVGGYAPAQIQSWFEEEGIQAEAIDDAAAAVRRGMELSAPGDMLFITGSLYLVGEVYPIFRPTDEVPISRKRILVVTGAFGSGKTEFAINYSLMLSSRGEDVALIDLDFVNPYFRSRDLKALLESQGIRVISSREGADFADLPALSQGIYSIFDNDTLFAVFDVGGDPSGARGLARFRDRFERTDYEMVAVLNVNRPFTRDADAAEKMIREIELSSGLRVSGIISNTHLSGDTSYGDIVKGVEVAKKVGTRLGIPVKAVCCGMHLARIVGDEIEGLPVFLLDRFMLPPWEG